MRAGGTGRAEASGEDTRRAAHRWCCSEESLALCGSVSTRAEQKKNLLSAERPSGRAAERIRPRSLSVEPQPAARCGHAGRFGSRHCAAVDVGGGLACEASRSCEAARPAKRPTKRIRGAHRPASTHTALVSQSLVGLCVAFPSINHRA